MADTQTIVAAHYGAADLTDRIMAALAAAGIGADAVSAEDLKAVDEFHIGGVGATAHLLDPLEIGAQTRVLDLGCGIGGTARFVAERYGAQVTGIDLTPEFVATAERLTSLVGGQTSFVTGSVLDLPFSDGSFDLATLLHVGMNIPDKARLFAEVARVLAPGGTFAVYDVMAFGAHPSFPVPWAAAEDASFLAPPEVYEAAGGAAGLTLLRREDRGSVARAFFADLQAKIAANGPPPVGLPILMGEDAGVKVANMVAAVEAEAIQPVEMIWRRPE